MLTRELHVQHAGVAELAQVIGNAGNFKWKSCGFVVESTAVPRVGNGRFPFASIPLTTNLILNIASLNVCLSGRADRLMPRCKT